MIEMKLSRKQFHNWLEDPVTIEFFKLLIEHRDANKQAVTESFFSVTSIADIDLTKVAEFRGQYNACEIILDIDRFLQEKLKIEEVRDDTRTEESEENVYPFGPKSHS